MGSDRKLRSPQCNQSNSQAKRARAKTKSNACNQRKVNSLIILQALRKIPAAARQRRAR
jgi:hypothetical protein